MQERRLITLSIVALFLYTIVLLQVAVHILIPSSLTAYKIRPSKASLYDVKANQRDRTT